MLGELSGSIAHELNSPLSAILNNAQAAQRILANGQADLGEVQEILNEIVSEDRRAGEVIRRLQLWLKKGEVQRHSLCINEVVQDVLKLIRSELINQNVSVDIKLARDLPSVTGDLVQLQQVLLNLVVNACDAMADCDTPERRLLIRTGIENGVPQSSYPLPTGVTAFRRKKRNKSSSLSLPQKQKVWGWAFRSAGPSLPRIEENFGLRTMPTAARRSISLCL